MWLWSKTMLNFFSVAWTVWPVEKFLFLHSSSPANSRYCSESCGIIWHTSFLSITLRACVLFNACCHIDTSVIHHTNTLGILHNYLLLTWYTRYYTQTRLAEDAFSDLLTVEDKELTQLGTIKMILMEQVYFVCMLCSHKHTTHRSIVLIDQTVSARPLTTHICQTWISKNTISHG